jgi:hypothetical protein
VRGELARRREERCLKCGSRGGGAGWVGAAAEAEGGGSGARSRAASVQRKLFILAA